MINKINYELSIPTQYEDYNVGDIINIYKKAQYMSTHVILFITNPIADCSQEEYTFLFLADDGTIDFWYFMPNNKELYE